MAEQKDQNENTNRPRRGIWEDENVVMIPREQLRDVVEYDHIFAEPAPKLTAQRSSETELDNTQSAESETGIATGDTAQPGRGHNQDSQTHSEDSDFAQQAGHNDGRLGSASKPVKAGTAESVDPLKVSIKQQRANNEFRSAIGWSVAGTIIPGVGLIGTKAKLIGILCTGCFLISVVFLGWQLATKPISVASAALSGKMLLVIAVALLVLAGIWIATIIGTHLIRRPNPASRKHRVIGSVVVGLLSFIVAAPMFVASSYAYTSSKVLNSVFSSKNSTRSETRPNISNGNIWQKDRLNILLLGGDSSAGRDIRLGVRTDTIILASIDVKTGNTALIQVPRNMANVPFDTSTYLGSELAKRYPRGFTNGNPNNGEYMINAIWVNVPEANKDLFTNTDYPGADALKIAVAGATGIFPDYFLLLDIDGLQSLIDAMGGVTVNINQRLPMGGGDGRAPSGWLDKGPNQHLDGYRAMWYARSRQSTSDYDRMARQSCLIKAVINQTDPSTMLTKFEAIAEASSRMVMTDIPQEMLSGIVELSGKVKGAKITRTLFIHGKDGYNTSNPDFNLVKFRVSEAIAASNGESYSNSNSPQPTASSTANPNTTGQPNPSGRSSSAASSTTSASPSSSIENVDDVCSYHG